MKDFDLVRDIPSLIRLNTIEFQQLENVAKGRGMTFAAAIRALALERAAQIETQNDFLAAQFPPSRAA